LSESVVFVVTKGKFPSVDKKEFPVKVRLLLPLIVTVPVPKPDTQFLMVTPDAFDNSIAG
jgi:hypothetical protein